MKQYARTANEQSRAAREICSSTRATASAVMKTGERSNVQNVRKDAWKPM